MIVVTAPTSRIGRQLLAGLLARKAAVRVIARDPEKLPADVRAAVDVVAGSHADPGVVERALAGADSVFWLVPADPRAPGAHAAYVDFTRPSLAALGAVERVVCISALGRGWRKDAGHVTATLAMDDLIAGTGVALRTLACPSFMDNLLRQIASIRSEGIFYGVEEPDAKQPACSTRDIASVAAGFLLDPAWTGFEEVPLLGPEDLSANDMAAILTDVLEKPVRYQPMPMAAFAKSLAGRMSEGMAQAMVNMMQAKIEGLDHIAARAKAAPTPTTFRTFAETVVRPAMQ